MEQILKNILLELQYHGRLLAEISMNTEPPKQTSEMKKSMMNSMELLKQQLADNPAIKNNPAMEKMIKDIVNIIPKGE